MNTESGFSEITGSQSIVHSDRSVSSSIDGKSAKGSASNINLPLEISDSTTETREWVKTSAFEVFMKTLDGKTVTIKVEEDEVVESFRKKVEEKTKVPVWQQYLLSAGGRKLIDGERLNKYDIKKYSTIYCQGRLRGEN